MPPPRWKDAPEPAPATADGEGDAEPAAPNKSGKRVCYGCPECGLKAWAKHEARLVCGEHMMPMEPQE